MTHLLKDHVLITAPPSTARRSVEIDVVIPLFNKAEYVGAAIASVLAQKTPPARIIVVDDGSTDGGDALVDGMGNPKINLLRQKRGGVSSARNAGIAASTAPIVAFLDADDEWTPDHLAALTRLAMSFPQCQVFATAYVFRTAGADDRTPVVRLGRGDEDRVLSDYFDLASRSDPPLFSSAVAVTREALDALGGFPVGIAQGEDLLTWARLAARFSIAYCPTASAAFRQPDVDDGTPTRSPEANDRVGHLLRQLLNELPRDCRPSLKRYISLWHKMRGSMYLALGEAPAARKELFQAISQTPAAPRLWTKLLLTLIPASQARRIFTLWRSATRRRVTRAVHSAT